MTAESRACRARDEKMSHDGRIMSSETRPVRRS
jgi:hypothetical protein